MSCPHCGAAISEGATFCPSCGEMVLATPPPAAPAPSAPPKGSSPASGATPGPGAAPAGSPRQQRPRPQVVPVPQRPTRQRPPSQPRGRTRQQVPQGGPYPGQQQGPYAGYPGQQRQQYPPQQFPPQQFPPQGGGPGYPGGYGDRRQVRRGPGCGGMLLRLILLVLAIPVLLTLAGAVLGFGLLSGGQDDTASPSPTSSWSASPTESPTDSATESPTPTDGTSGASSGTTGPTGSASSSPVTSAPTTAAAYPAARITGRECARTGTGPYAATAAGNDRTSCAFAVAVQRAYVAAGGAGSTTTVTAYSQARDANVRLLCTDDQPAQCVSSTGALVFLYGGEAVVG